MLQSASFEDIKKGLLTDIYFQRTLEVLKAKGIDKRVRAEFIVKNLPHDWQWAVLAGIEEATELLTTLDVSVRAMPEGTIFRPFQPILEIEGMYTDFAIYETALLGILCQSSGVATKAARCRKVAGDKPVISFGARRMHPAAVPMIERSAFIGGCDGTSVVMAAQMIGEAASGTMPHALILVMGSTVEATRAFDEVMPADVPRVSLIDTFNDEKFEALNVASALGERLSAVRLDTPGSRRGNFRLILEEVRWELDLRDFQHVKLFVSGGIDEPEIRDLRDIADAFGVGTAISNAPVVDLSLDIVEIDGQPLAKRGKWSGAKNVWRCSRCFSDFIRPLNERSPACPCGGTTRNLLEQLTSRGQLSKPLPDPHRIRQYVLEQLNRMDL